MDNSSILKEEKNPKSLLGKKTKNHSSNKFSSSNSVGFQIEQEDDGIIFEFKHISNYSELKKELSLIISPCTLKNKELLDKISSERKSTNKTIKLSKSFFNELKEEDVKFINNGYIKEDDLDYKSDKNIYFSSSILKVDTDNDKEIFDNIHNYKTGYSGNSKISKLCFNRNIYFPFSSCDEYIWYNRKFSHSFRAHHYHSDCDFGLGKILYHFGPKGVGKSICGRATIFNYLHFDLLKKNRKVFFPSLLLDLKIWNEMEK